MVLVKPTISPPAATAARPVSAPPAHGLDQAGATAENAFKPGLKAPRAAVSQPVNAQPTQAARQTSEAAPAGEARQLFTLQALSAYAGAIINELEPDTGSAAAPRRRETNGATPPPRPGGQLDLKV